MTDFYDLWEDWFNQDINIKMGHLRQSGKGGYYPPYSETPGYTGNKDPKEYFHFREHHKDLSPCTYSIFQQCYLSARDWLARMDMPHLLFPPEYHVLRIIHYFPTEAPIVGEAHKDFDLLTISLPGTIPGLEVFKNGVWVAEEEGMHIGEMLEIHAGIPAVTHRVNVPAKQERYKAVFFYLPPDGFELRPGYTAADYLREALSKAGTIDIGKEDTTNDR